MRRHEEEQTVGAALLLRELRREQLHKDVKPRRDVGAGLPVEAREILVRVEDEAVEPLGNVLLEEGDEEAAGALLLVSVLAAEEPAEVESLEGDERDEPRGRWAARAREALT